MAGESINYGSIQLAPLPSSEITVKKWLKLRCKLTYKPRMVKNRGAILVLVWNCLIMNIFTLLNDGPKNGESHWSFMVGLGLIPPIAGWLADVRFGRYKVIKWSIWVMWIALVMETASSVVAKFIDRYDKIDQQILFICVFFIISIGIGGYQANIIQFGIDQLNDASTDEIKSFISWYAITIIIGGTYTEIIFLCLTGQQYKSLELLFVC